MSATIWFLLSTCVWLVFLMYVIEESLKSVFLSRNKMLQYQTYVWFALLFYLLSNIDLLIFPNLKMLKVSPALIGTYFSVSLHDVFLRVTSSVSLTFRGWWQITFLKGRNTCWFVVIKKKVLNCNERIMKQNKMELVIVTD